MFEAKMQGAAAKDVVREVMLYYVDRNFCLASLKRYQAAYRSIVAFYQQVGRREYSPETTQKYVADKHAVFEAGEIGMTTFRYHQKFCDMADRYYLTGEVTAKNLRPLGSREPLPKEKALLERFVHDCLAGNYAVRTIRGIKYDAQSFLFFCKDPLNVPFESLTHDNISDYLLFMAKRRPKSLRPVIRNLRIFLGYLFAQGLLACDLREALNVTVAAHHNVHIGFSEDETNRMILATKSGEALGKRDYAMMLLAKYTGLRGIDIINLKLADIDWRKSEITVRQSKTGVTVTLPLIGIVGNAIAEYLLHSRPESTSDSVFIRTIHPYDGLLYHGDVVERYAKIVGINTMGIRPIGMHSFRRYLGVSLLTSEVQISTISEVLGHSYPDSIQSYLGLDTEHLKLCPMPMGAFKCQKEELL